MDRGSAANPGVPDIQRPIARLSSSNDRRVTDPVSLSDPTPPLAGLHHVCIPCTDVSEAADWYEQHFGFVCTLVEEDEHEVVAIVLRHSSGCVLHLRRAPNRAAHLCGFPLVSLSVPDRVALDEWGMRLSSSGVVCSEVQPAHLGWERTVEGPDGIYVQLHTAEQLSGIDS